MVEKLTLLALFDNAARLLHVIQSSRIQTRWFHTAVMHEMRLSGGAKRNGVSPETESEHLRGLMSAKAIVDKGSRSL